MSENDCVVNKSFNVLNTSSTNQISDTNVNNDSSLLVDTDVTDIGNLNILSLNCCGVKLRLQYPEFCQLVCNQDIICLQETKTDDLDTIELPGYIFKMKNRKKIGRKSGGMILAYKESLENYIELLDIESKYVLWFKVSSKLVNLNEDVIFGNVYIPPEGSPYFQPDTFDQIENEIRTFSQNYKYISLFGDFNSRTAEEPDFIDFEINEHEQDFTEFLQNDLATLNELNIDKNRKNVDKVKSRSGNNLLDICKANNLFIVNGRIGDDKTESGKLTCKNSSVVDYCICTCSFLQFVYNFKVLDFCRLYSDVHSPTITNLKFKLAAGNDQSTSNNSNDILADNRAKKWDASKHTAFNNNIDKEKLNGLYNEIVNTLIDDIDKDKVNSFVSELCNLLIDSAKTTFGTHKYKTRPDTCNKKPKGDKPWFNYECKVARQNYRKLKRKLKIKRTEALKQDVAEAEKRYKKTLDKHSKIYRADMRKKIKKLKTSDPKEYWKLLNKGRDRKQPNIPLGDLFKFFKNLNKAPDELLVQQENFDTDLLDNVNIGPLNEEINFSITQEEILRCIKKLKNNKACGEDYVVNEYIKSTSDLFLPTYEKIFNAIFNSGVMPDIWLVGNIKPIYKNKGNPLDPKNFRPITILSCLGKLFTAILNERLCRFSEEALLMNENQFGFRKSYSTTDSFFTLFSFFEILKRKKKKLFCAFVDFEKAFDTVWRDALWYKLLLNHINGKMYTIILNMYTDVKSCITYNYCKSDYFNCDMGVRQGENVSLFYLLCS